MARIELVVTDLDGTLWHTADEVHPGIPHAWAEVVARVPLLVATGRRVGSTRGPLARIGVAPPAVVLNGALVLDLASGHRYQRAPFPAAQAAAALAAFRDAGVEPCVYVDGGCDGPEVLVGSEPSTNPGHLAALGRAVAVADLDTAVGEEVVLAFSIIGIPHGVLADAAAVLGPVAEVHLDRALDYPGMASLTVAPRGQSKWNGVLAFCAEHSLDPARVLAVADGPNDVELLTHAAVAVVPEEAHISARQLADLTIPAALHGGWTSLPGLLHELTS
ncbi:MAG: HAD hydrolase family protein [Actinomycetota bacterium]|nr:HAD hydrolase family protein [Actinomycetota bacterium]